MNSLVKLSLAILFLILSNPLVARHIIGGEITYVCLGNGDYDFTMKVYRDCDGGGAGFDNNARVTIFDGQIEVTTLSVFLAGQTADVEPDPDPCIIVPPNVCVEEATYRFRLSDYNISLPLSSNSYHITYQRCCRNNFITNIENAATSGATYTMELTPDAQAECNSSPVYNDFPPIVICAGIPFDFDHSATDSEGDQLVYTLCDPLLGGGPGGSSLQPGDPSDCLTGISPNPACPPPYDPVDFASPPYSTTNPLGINAGLAIDPVTGVITGLPDVAGQFVVGVCVSEYRNGQLLSVVRRDFQFNVTSCENLTFPNIAEDVNLGPRQFQINTCGEQTLTIINESSQQNVNDFRWEFDLGNSVDTFFNWSNVVIEFPDTGQYNGLLVLNPTSICSDTGFIEVNIYPNVEADFNFEYDTCVAGPVNFTDVSVSPLSGSTAPIVDWQWNFRDGNSSNEQSPVHAYTDPGDYNVRLTVVDQNECQDIITKMVNWYPVPPLLIIEPSSEKGCYPIDVFFNNLSTPIDSTYDIVWDFGNGDISNQISPTTTFDIDGFYSPSLYITSPIGCETDTVFSDLVEVVPPPVADFDFSEEVLNNFQPAVDLIDASIDAVHWEWFFQDQVFTRDQNTSITFPDTGLQVIKLIVTSIEQCRDSVSKIIDVEPHITYFLPNAFSPNNDSTNDLFKGVGYFRGIKNFNMVIWNRWGVKVFETNNIEEGWNGKRNNTGKLLQNGVYPLIVRYTGPRGMPYEIKGIATLIR